MVETEQALQVVKNITEDPTNGWHWITFVGFFITWIGTAALWIYSKGRQKGIDDQKEIQLSVSLENLKTEIQKDIARLESSLEEFKTETKEDFAGIEKTWIDSDGNPKYLLISDHKIICGEHKSHAESEFGHIGTGIQEVRSDMRSLKDAVMSFVTSGALRKGGSDDG